MKNKYVYVADEKWFESTSLRNPIMANDFKLKEFYPEYFETEYDLKLLASKVPTQAERSSLIYNDSIERNGNTDIEILKIAAEKQCSQNVFLNGFKQEHFDYIAPFIKNTTEVLYLCKCRFIKDLSVLSEFEKLKCVLIFGNSSLESLWDMSNNKNLKVLSFDYITKLREIESLKHSSVEYVSFSSMDFSSNKKELLMDTNIFREMPELKHLKLVYKKCNIDY